MKEIIIKLSKEVESALLEKYGNEVVLENHIYQQLNEEADNYIAKRKNAVNSWFQGLTLVEKREVQEMGKNIFNNIKEGGE